MKRRQAAPTGAEGVDALVTDRYLDALLASGDACAALGPHPGSPAAPIGSGPLAAGPDELRRAGEVVRSALVRIHPSFRFEERLARRLADLAEARAAGLALAAGTGPGAVIPFPGTRVPAPARDDVLEAILDGRLDPGDERAVARAEGLRSTARPLIVGGAITSAALSLVGVAWVAWRSARTASPVGRPAADFAARRMAELADLAAGAPGGPP